jgi:hypothetical protein
MDRVSRRSRERISLPPQIVECDLLDRMRVFYILSVQRFDTASGRSTLAAHEPPMCCPWNRSSVATFRADCGIRHVARCGL